MGVPYFIRNDSLGQALTCQYYISKRNKLDFFNLHHVYKSTTFAIFEFMILKEKKISNVKQAYELGKYLGKLHKLAKTFPLSKTGQGYNSFNRELSKNFYLTKNAPKKYIEILDYVKNYYPKLKVPTSQPKPLCHIEFTSQHVKFKGNK